VNMSDGTNPSQSIIWGSSAKADADMFETKKPRRIAPGGRLSLGFPWFNLPKMIRRQYLALLPQIIDWLGLVPSDMFTA